MTKVAGGSTYAQLSMSGNQTVSLIAPAHNINADGTPCSSVCANTTEGLIFFQDRTAPATTSVGNGGAVTAASGAKTSNINVLGSTLNSFAGCGNSTTCRTLSGTLYFPRQTMSIAGNGTVQGTCFGLVSKYLDDAGTPTFMNG